MSSLHPVAACVRRAARGLRGQRAQKAALLAASAALGLLACVRASAWVLAQLATSASVARLAERILDASAGLPLALALAGVAALAAAAAAWAWPIDEARLALAIDGERGLSDLFASAWEFARVEPARQSAFVRATLERAASIARAIPGEPALPRLAPRELVWLGALLVLGLVVALPLPPMAARTVSEAPREPAALATPQPLLSPHELERQRARLARAQADSAAIAAVRAELQKLLDTLEAGRIERVQALRELRAIEQHTEALGLASARLERALRELARRFAAQPATRALGQRLEGGSHGGELARAREASGLAADAGEAPPLEAGSAEQAHQRALDMAAARAELARLAQRLREPGVDARAVEALRSALSAARARPGTEADAAGAGLGTGAAPAEPSQQDGSRPGPAEPPAQLEGSNPGAAGPPGAAAARADSDLDPESGRQLERLERDLERAERALGEAQPSAAADALDRAGRELERLEDAQRAAEQAPRLRDEIAQLRESLRRGANPRAKASDRPSAAQPSAAEDFGLAAADAELGSAAGESASPEVTAQPTRVAGLAQAGPTRSQVIFGAAQPGEVSSAYARVHADYAQHAERELEREPIPPGYRLYVRRYFQLVGPRVARGTKVERSP